jgi:hypothetical protein
MKKEAFKQKWQRFIKDIQQKWNRLTKEISKRRERSKLHRKSHVKHHRPKHKMTAHHKHQESRGEMSKRYDEANPRKKGQKLGPERERNQETPSRGFHTEQERKTSKYEKEYFRGEEDFDQEDFPRRKAK